MRTILMLCFSLLMISGYSQAPTVGLKQNTAAAYNGYTLFTGMDSQDTYLINNCGEVINVWTSEGFPSFTAYFAEDGHLYRTTQVLFGNGIHLEKQDWEGNVVWDVNLSSFGIRQHHDLEVLPNGNVLLIADDPVPQEAALALGRDSVFFEGLTNSLLGSERIVEVKQTAFDSLEIVWQWRAVDHVVQNVYPNKPNYGMQQDYPERLDINFAIGPPGPNGNFDWLHYNAIDYNSELDQIVISSRNTSEIYIIDHSTTTAEAASHAGGNSGRGGDYLFRWGNDRIFGNTSAQQEFYGQHNAEWIPNDYVHGGMISVYNNGNNRPNGFFSSVEIINPEILPDGSYVLDSVNGGFLPLDFHWHWEGEIEGEFMFSTIISSADVQPNGNVVINEGISGRFIEVDIDGNTIWQYTNPGSPPAPQGSTVFSWVFRAKRYDTQYDGFLGKDVSPLGIVEDMNSISDSCMIYDNPSSLEEPNVKDNVVIFPNPVSYNMAILSKNTLVKEAIIFDCLGTPLLQLSYPDIVNLENFNSGTYYVKCKLSSGETEIKKIIVSRN